MTLHSKGTLALSALAYALTLAGAAGCYSSDSDGLLPCGIEERPAGPMEIEAHSISPLDGSWMPLTDGAALPMWSPLDGGSIMVIGALVLNLGACEANVIGRLRDPTRAGELVTRESLIVPYQAIVGRPGWAEPKYPRAEPWARRYMGANLPLCHNYEDRDIDGCPWILELSVEDDDTGRSAESRFSVLPFCPSEDIGAYDELAPTLCECQCAAKYHERSDCRDHATEWSPPPPPEC